MRTALRSRSLEALTLTEVLVVIVTAVVLFGVLLPWVAINTRPRRFVSTSRIACVNNLKQVALAFRMWANDNGDRFPMTVSTNEKGTLEFAASAEVFRHFQSASSELCSPKILVCPRDTTRVRATTFFSPEFANSNVSYFINLDADPASPQTILAGDRNITGGTMTAEGTMFFRTNSLLGWTSGIHTNAGNLGLVDGSVQQVGAEGLRRHLKAVTNEFLRLALPLVTQ